MNTDETFGWWETGDWDSHRREDIEKRGLVLLRGDKRLGFLKKISFDDYYLDSYDSSGLMSETLRCGLSESGWSVYASPPTPKDVPLEQWSAVHLGEWFCPEKGMRAVLRWLAEHNLLFTHQLTRSPPHDFGYADWTCSDCGKWHHSVGGDPICPCMPRGFEDM